MRTMRCTEPCFFFNSFAATGGAVFVALSGLSICGGKTVKI